MKLSVWGLGYVGSVDFVRITDSPSVSGVYEGICW
jgi:hypothetical protein